MYSTEPTHQPASTVDDLQTRALVGLLESLGHELANQNHSIQLALPFVEAVLIELQSHVPVEARITNLQAGDSISGALDLIRSAAASANRATEVFSAFQRYTTPKSPHLVTLREAMTDARALLSPHLEQARRTLHMSIDGGSEAEVPRALIGALLHLVVWFDRQAPRGAFSIASDIDKARIQIVISSPSFAQAEPLPAIAGLLGELQLETGSDLTRLRLNFQPRFIEP